MIKSTQHYLKKNQRKRSLDGQVKSKKVTKFEVGNYVLLQYPNNASGQVIWSLSWTNGNYCDRSSKHHQSARSNDRQSLLRPYQSAATFQAEMTKEDIEVLSAIDLDEYYVDKIVAHEENGQNPKN